MVEFGIGRGMFTGPGKEVNKSYYTNTLQKNYGYKVLRSFKVI